MDNGLSHLRTPIPADTGLRPRSERARPPAFTLLELLVVIGILALLLAFLLPTLSSARRQARRVQCASNVRQICVAFNAYAADHRGWYPPNRPSLLPGQFWWDPQRVGGYLGGSPAQGGGVMTCPEQDDGSRTYAMNVWMSSRADGLVPASELWRPGSRAGSQAILIIEARTGFGSDADGWSTWAYVGHRGASAGERFGGGAGIQPPFTGGRFGPVTCELDYSRHRPHGGRVTVRGALHIGYSDGHAALKAGRDLVDPETGRSTLDSLWSPKDPQHEAAQ